MRRPVFVVSAVVAALATLALASPAQAAKALTIDQAVPAAVAYAEDHYSTAGVAVLDTETGQMWSTNGEDLFGSASVVKVFVAARLLVEGKMAKANNDELATKMIEYSDNKAYEKLAPKVGGLDVITWAADYYNVPDLGTVPFKEDCWGNTQISAAGMVKFYAAVKQDPVVAPWLLDRMHNHKTIAATGDNQDFGIPSAANDVAVKQGWGICSSNTDGHVINSTGFVGDGDRYAIAILTNSNKWRDGNFVERQGAVATGMAQLLLPRGKVKLPES